MIIGESLLKQTLQSHGMQIHPDMRAPVEFIHEGLVVQARSYNVDHDQELNDLVTQICAHGTNFKLYQLISNQNSTTVRCAVW